MRVRELSHRSGISIASIKYYLREGLLLPGVATGRNQAEYAESHVRRLRLIRALLDVGGLSIAAAKQVLAAVDAPEVVGHELLGRAHNALDVGGRRDPSDPIWQAARAEIISLIAQRGWWVDDCSPSLDRAADAVAAMRQLGQTDLLVCLPIYAEAAELVAKHEVDAVLARHDPTMMVEGVITGTVLGEALLMALRRLAEQDASARRLGESGTDR